MTGEWNKSHTQDKKGEPNVRSWSIIDKEKKKKTKKNGPTKPDLKKQVPQK